jgi:hypothetical protein
MQGKLLGIISVDFSVTGKLLIIFCAHQNVEKKREQSEAVQQLFIEFKQAYDSVRREVL